MYSFLYFVREGRINDMKGKKKWSDGRYCTTMGGFYRVSQQSLHCPFN